MIGLSVVTSARHRAAAVVVGVAVAGSLLAEVETGKAQEAGTGVIGEAVDLAQCTGEAPEGTSALYGIAADGTSTARYRAQEELRGIGQTEAVGETPATLGSIYLDDAGMPLACSRIDVDLRTLQSDEVRRDNYLYENTLETETYPLATFIVSEVQGLDSGLADGEEATFQLVGNLTLHGVTKQVTWDITASRDGGQLTGTASTSFEMPDFDIEPPTVGPVVSLDETIVLEIDVLATAQE